MCHNEIRVPRNYTCLFLHQKNIEILKDLYSGLGYSKEEFIKFSLQLAPTETLHGLMEFIPAEDWKKQLQHHKISEAALHVLLEKGAIEQTLFINYPKVSQFSHSTYCTHNR